MNQKFSSNKYKTTTNIQINVAERHNGYMYISYYKIKPSKTGLVKTAYSYC